MNERDAREGTLDPENWDAWRALGHRMLDDMFDYIATIRERPVWRPIPEAARDTFRVDLPHQPCPAESVYEQFQRSVVPYAAGNVHPGFMGWVHGGGTPIGVLSEMLSAGLNANLGGRDHMPIEVERQIVSWTREMFGFPESASGLFVTGASMASFLAVVIARTRAMGAGARKSGNDPTRQLRAYASSGAHICIANALDLAGLGSACLRNIPTDSCFRIDLKALRAAITVDRAQGLHPFLVVGTAGAVDTGAIDDLSGLAEICAEENLTFHIDGAIGALLVWAPELAPLIRGIERADSIAMDFHKWGQVPYDAGFLLVRDSELHRAAFASPASYLRQESRGLAAGAPWPSEFGPDLSRGFRALKTWFTIKTYGVDHLGAVIARTVAVAKHLAERIESERELELMAPAPLNIVCFRYRCEESDTTNAAIVADLHEAGLVAPSTTILGGRLAIRAAIVNHRTLACDADALVDNVLRLGRRRQG